MRVDCAGAGGPAAGGGLAVSRALACCLSFCLGSSCGSLRGPISPMWTGVLCCDSGEDHRAKGHKKKPNDDTLLGHYNINNLLEKY